MKKNKEILQSYKDKDLAVDAEITSKGIMFSEKDVLILMSLSNAELAKQFKEELNLHKAEQQLYGFKMGQDIELNELVDSMGLTLEEFDKIKEEFAISSYLTNEDINYIYDVIS